MRHVEVTVHSLCEPSQPTCTRRRQNTAADEGRLWAWNSLSVVYTRKTRIRMRGEDPKKLKVEKVEGFLELLKR